MVPVTPPPTVPEPSPVIGILLFSSSPRSCVASSRGVKAVQAASRAVSGCFIIVLLLALVNFY